MAKEVLDILIVGAGPAGTAAAFRAHELKLNALLIDVDEILSLLKDWMSPDDKLLSANYGPGGKAVPFPCGGALVDRLVFGDATPASQLYGRWRPIFDENGLPVQNGVEMVGLEIGAGGLLRALCVEAASRERPELTAKHIVLAMGRGMPTKLEVPGDTAGIDFKVRDAQRYIGRPACVIGGGDSAAEAVIALSRAKAAANDPSDVFWACRKRSLKVNSQLAEAFFAAFSGNGNIRYLPFSEALAVLKNPDGSEFVAVRSDRREVAARPTEGTFLEFSKEQVLACIGAKLPLQFLESIGVRQFTSAVDDEAYVAVTPWFETQVRNVFMVGELLAPSFIQTRDFRPEAQQSTVINHGGNFKRSMIDAVLAVDAIAARLAGKSDDELVTLMDRRAAEFKERHAARGELPAAKAAVTAQVQAPQLGARVVKVALGLDGQLTVGSRELLAPGRHVIGGATGQITFPADKEIVDNHAAVLVEPDACYVTVDGMQGPVSLRVAVERTIEVGDVIRAGAQRVRVDSVGGSMMLAVLDAESDNVVRYLPVFPDGRSYGRKASSRGIEVDGRDAWLSGRHFYVESAGSVVKLRDYGSTNGTYLEVRGTLRLYDGDIVFLSPREGLRLEGMQTAVEKTRPQAPTSPAAAKNVADTIVAKRPASPPEPAQVRPGADRPLPKEDKAPRKAGDKPAAEGAGGAPSLRLEPIGETLPIAAGQTVLDRLLDAKLAAKSSKDIKGKVQMLYECKAGTCGKCIFKIEGGEANLSKLTSKEKRTLKNIVEDLAAGGRELDADKCHLACKATVTGPVVIGLLGDTEP